MDIGSSAYTEYKESVDVISYRAQNDLIGEDIFEGLIHSHNTMATFFSTTDCNTLAEEGTNSNHFVSLIVNNAGTYTAGVTRRVITESTVESSIKTTSTRYYNTYGGEKITLAQDEQQEEDKSETTTSSVVEWYNLTIVKEEALCPFQDIDDRLAEIRKNKAKTPSYSASKWNQTTPVKSSPSYPPYNHSTYNPSYPSLFGRDDDDDDYSIYDDMYNMGGHIVSSASGGSGTAFQGPQEETLQEEEEEDEAPVASAIVPLCLQESFDDDMVKHIALQLLTSTIMISEDAVDPVSWVMKMDAVYEKRFGNLDPSAHPGEDEDIILTNNVRLEQWLDGLAEFLMYTRDEALLNRLNLIGETMDTAYDEADTAEVCAYDVCEYLRTLPESYVKDKIINTLSSTYIPKDVENFK